MTGSVRVVAIITAQEGKGGQLLEIWPQLAAKVRAEDGCLAYDLHSVRGDDNRFVVLERWNSTDALRAHGKSPHMRDFRLRGAMFLAGEAEVMVLPDSPVA